MEYLAGKNHHNVPNPKRPHPLLLYWLWMAHQKSKNHVNLWLLNMLVMTGSDVGTALIGGYTIDDLSK